MTTDQSTVFDLTSTRYVADRQRSADSVENVDLGYHCGIWTPEIEILKIGDDFVGSDFT